MIATIGYEGAALGEFVATLKHAEIEIVIDVRDRAQSRKAGFSKTALSERLSEDGIRYMHLRELGDPKEGRDAARSGDMVGFHRIFLGVLGTDAAKAAVNLIIKEATDSSVCLLCYERDFTDCHRKLISEQIESITGGKTHHLGVKSFDALSQHRG